MSCVSDNGQPVNQTPLAITPNYIKNPVFPYGSNDTKSCLPDMSRSLNCNHTNDSQDNPGKFKIAKLQ